MDLAHEQTDALIAKAEKQIAKEYKKAVKETTAKMNQFLMDFQQQMDEKLADPNVDPDEYSKWLDNQLLKSEQWQGLVSNLSEDFHNANKLAVSTINGHLGEAYALNYNYETFYIEQGAKANTMFTLYSEESVERITRENPALLPTPTKEQKTKLTQNGDKLWQRGKIQSLTTQSILQGESIPNMARRICTELGNTNYKAATRYARTSMTAAQNAGRDDAYRRAKDLGIGCKRRWLATMDNRTRHQHRMLDRQIAEVNEPFVVDGEEIMYPGDPRCKDPSLIWNCRCTTIAEIEGLTHDFDGISMEGLEGKSYEEWQTEHDTIENAKKAEAYWEKKQKALPKDLNKTFDGIWKNQSVSYADWDAKKDSIPAKRDFYEQKIAEYNANGDSYSAMKMQMKLDELNEFEANGAKYSQLLQKQEQYKQEISNARARQNKLRATAQASGGGQFPADAYSQARKDAAVWAQSDRDADNVLRKRTGDVWQAASKAEKDAIHDYTGSYSKFNEPLRGWEYGESNYSTGSGFKGVGNTDLNAGYANNGKALNAMTDIIDKCSYDTDIWLQRGCSWGGMDTFFQCDMDLLQNGTQQELERELMGKICTEYGFFSCGSSKGNGFAGKPIIMNVYAPEGTKMMYVEPFSHYGMGDGRSWDGKSGQRYFGSELETILQQGTQFRVMKVEKSWDTIYVDLDVVNQLEPQRWNE